MEDRLLTQMAFVKASDSGVWGEPRGRIRPLRFHDTALIGRDRNAALRKVLLHTTDTIVALRFLQFGEVFCGLFFLLKDLLQLPLIELLLEIGRFEEL